MSVEIGQEAPDFVIDGEVVAFEGRQTSFARLQGRMHLRDAGRARRARIAIKLYAMRMMADPNAYRGYHQWQVIYRTQTGNLLLPEGYPEVPAAPR